MFLMLKYALLSATVLMLVALGGCFSEHSGVINLALEGIMVIGGLVGTMALNLLPADMLPVWKAVISGFITMMPVVMPARRSSAPSSATATAR